MYPQHLAYIVLCYLTSHAHETRVSFIQTTQLQTQVIVNPRMKKVTSFY